MSAPFTVRPVGDAALLLEVGEEAGGIGWQEVELAFEAIRARALAGVVNLHPAEASLLIELDPVATDFLTLEREIARALALGKPEPARQRRRVEVPVCYEPPCAPDLADFAALHRLSLEEAVRAHCDTLYTVHFLGFTAGFPYLGGLPATLATPRLATPRKRVPPGSVAIGGVFTGIYPSATAGGWRLIGRTPLRLFDPAADPPNRLQLGDEVRLRRISLSELDGTR